MGLTWSRIGISCYKYKILEASILVSCRVAAIFQDVRRKRGGAEKEVWEESKRWEDWRGVEKGKGEY